MSPMVVVTGMAGAGRSSALKILEDLGFEAVDNLPLALLPRLAADAGSDETTPLALGIDSRSRAFDPQRLLDQLARLGRGRSERVRLVFLDADDEVLLRRFTETRRRHPLAQRRPVVDGIVRERQMMAPLKAAADLVVDTSRLSVAGLRRILEGHFGALGRRELQITVVSFAFRHGLPREADLVFDVRFLANPHYVDELRPLSGRDPRVAAHVRGDPAYAEFERRLFALVDFLLPRYRAEGRRYLTVAVGCTGGRHRSVAVAERLAQHLRDRGLSPHLIHRDLAGDSPMAEAAP